MVMQAGPRAFSLTSLVAQRDAGTGRQRLRAAASSGALAAWTAAAGSAAAYPGMAACRRPAHRMTGAGARLRTGTRSRTPTASGSSWPGFPPLARCVVTGDQLRGQDDGPRAACTCGGRCQAPWQSGRPCRRQMRISRVEGGDAYLCGPAGAARWREPGIAGPRANPAASCFPRACPLLSRLLFVGAWARSCANGTFCEPVPASGRRHFGRSLSALRSRRIWRVVRSAGR
jgi:hypothetical protein